MRKLTLLFLLLISLITNAQEPVDSLSVAKDSIKNLTLKSLFSDADIRLMDSLLIKSKFNSPLYDSLPYVTMKDVDAKGLATVPLTTKILKERLRAINAKTPFHVAYNIALEKVIKSYLKNRSKVFPTLMARAQYYFPMFEKYLDKYDIPLEMKYLAVVESALKPRVRSRMGASGLWQFMYTTGRQFGLKISSYVDERRDPIKSTIAACKYLSVLHTIFKDWDLALAAYNSGPGNVTKAIKRSGGYKNYWNIRPFLPRETASYVPAFYATMYLFKYAKEHHLTAKESLIRYFETDTVRIKKTVSFKQISEKTGTRLATLQFLNPAYKLNIIPYVKNHNYVLTLPKAQVIIFLEKEQNLYAFAAEQNDKREKPLPKYFEMDKRLRYKVRSGDFLGKIAEKFGVRVSAIKRWNRLKNNRLRIGQRLYIYPKRLPKIAFSKKRKGKTKFSKASYTIYVIKKGDSLWTIAKKFPRVSVEQIKKWNNIWSVKDLKVGKKLKIFKS